jgi:hypothetical protein
MKVRTLLGAGVSIALISLAMTGLSSSTALAGGAAHLTSPATARQSSDGAWILYNASVIDPTNPVGVRLAAPTENSSAYAYNSTIDYAVTAGDVISFNVDTHGGTYCTTNGPSVYVVVDGRGFASYDDGTPCPGDTTSTQDDGRVSFTIPETGPLTYAQVYYYDSDADGVGGVVDISDLRLNNDLIYFGTRPPPAQDVPVATPYGATLSKPVPCRVRTNAFLDAALTGQIADPAQRRFVTRVDGQVRSAFTLNAGDEGHARFHVRANTGKRMVTVRLANGELLDRTVVRTGRC